MCLSCSLSCCKNHNQGPWFFISPPPPNQLCSFPVWPLCVISWLMCLNICDWHFCVCVSYCTIWLKQTSTTFSHTTLSPASASCIPLVQCIYWLSIAALKVTTNWQQKTNVIIVSLSQEFEHSLARSSASCPGPKSPSEWLAYGWGINWRLDWERVCLQGHMAERGGFSS